MGGQEIWAYKTGRTLHHHRDQELLNAGRRQSASIRGRRDRKRRQHLVERSFADGANNHLRARWRRLWKQEIQGHLIAACQNIRLLLARGSGGQRGQVLCEDSGRAVWIGALDACSEEHCMITIRRKATHANATLQGR